MRKFKILIEENINDAITKTFIVSESLYKRLDANYNLGGFIRYNIDIINDNVTDKQTPLQEIENYLNHVFIPQNTTQKLQIETIVKGNNIYRNINLEKTKEKLMTIISQNKKDSFNEFMKNKPKSTVFAICMTNGVYPIYGK